MKPITLSKSETSALLKALKLLQKALKIQTTTEFARYLGISRSTLTGWFSKKAKPTEETAKNVKDRMANRLNALDAEADALAKFLYPVLVES